MTKYQKAINELIDNGWTRSHNATAKGNGPTGYTTAGTIRQMQDKNGFHYCRVYSSMCKLIPVGYGHHIRIQETTVLKKPITEKEKPMIIDLYKNYNTCGNHVKISYTYGTNTSEIYDKIKVKLLVGYGNIKETYFNAYDELIISTDNFDWNINEMLDSINEKPVLSFYDGHETITIYLDEI